MIQPLEPIKGVRADDLQLMLTRMLAKLPINQVFGESKTTNKKTQVHFTVFFDGAKENEAIVGKTLKQLLEGLPLRGNYTFEVKTTTNSPIIAPKGTGPLGFADRIWDRNCQVFIEDAPKRRTGANAA